MESLTPDAMEELKNEREVHLKSIMSEYDGILLLLGSSFLGPFRQINSASYAVVSVFFELLERYKIKNWSYTFSKDGLVFYIRIEEDAKALKNTMIHYEDYHPLGFAIDSKVYDNSVEVTRSMLNVQPRMDFYYDQPLDDLLKQPISDSKYQIAFVKRVEDTMLKVDKQSALSNILVYGYVSAFIKPMGFGMYGPNDKGANPQMNFDRFLYMLRTYKNEMRKFLQVNPRMKSDIKKFQKEIEKQIQLAVLNQDSYYFNIFVSSLVLFGFINSSGYLDIQIQIKKLVDDFYGDVSKLPDAKRYDISRTGFKEVFNFYVPFLQKHKSIPSTLLYIMSRYDDLSVCNHTSQKDLLKVQFLAKNLIHKPDKWIELHRFCVSNSIYPHDATLLLATTLMLDVIQRNYLKIKMLFDHK